MAATNATTKKATTTTKQSSSTAKTTSKASTSHPVLLQFTVGFMLILLASWFANISDDTGNLVAGLFALLWLLWLMNNSSRLKGITP